MQREHLVFLHKQTEKDQMTNDLAILQTNEANMGPREALVLWKINEKIKRQYLNDWLIGF